MPTTLIKQFPIDKRSVDENELYLNVAEMFCDTIQGEGVYTGVPATFIRLQGCTLSCKWCDTLEVWKQGNPYTFNEIFDLFESVGLIERFNQGQHLVLTGGSPLMQQKALAQFLKAFESKYHFVPFIECENEVMLRVEDLKSYVDCWNNSPKLSNSGMKRSVRYKPEFLHQVSHFHNPSEIQVESYFKFVVDCEEDWQEIQMDFIDTGLVERQQIILMPCGETQEELGKTREIAANLAIKHNVRFSDRLHVTIWNKKTGV